MRLVKIVVFVAVGVLLTGGAALSESITITIDKPADQSEVRIDVQGSDTPIYNMPGNPNQNLPGPAKAKMLEHHFPMKDTAIVVISNPCAWVYANGRWYWRCW